MAHRFDAKLEPRVHNVFSYMLRASEEFYCPILWPEMQLLPRTYAQAFIENL